MTCFLIIKMSSDKNYICKLCKEKFIKLKSYASHLQIHKHVKNFKFSCVSGCPRTYTKYSSFKAHISRNHKRPKIGNYSNCIALKCGVKTCQQNCSDESFMISHLQKHIKNNEKIECPFFNCSLVFHKRSSFSAHLSRKHPSLKLKSYKESDNVAENLFEHFENSQISANTQDSEISTKLLEDSKISPQAINHSLALFCLRLLSKFHLPSSVIDLIIAEIISLQELNMQSIQECLTKELVKIDVNEPARNSILKSIESNELLSLFSSNQNLLKSNYLRNAYFKKNFNYVEPIAIFLGRDRLNKKCFYHYVPILESLKALMQNNSVKFQVENPIVIYDNTSLTDYSDGTVFKLHNIFRESNFIKIFLYQDSFETVNPLGSAKKKHKILAVYYTLGNFYPWNRSKTDNMQLVILCKQKHFDYFGHKSVFKRLVDDIKLLEKGVSIEGNKIQQGSVFSIIGDNLGSHGIGGFVENFSTSQYHCRYCLVTKEKMFQETFYYVIDEMRTIENYVDCLDHIERENLNDYKGIKFNSVFNELTYFHVVQPGLPPCLGHDIFEGVVAYDVFLYVKELIKDNVFTIDFLNDRINKFPYSISDNSDKPASINIKGNKLSGHAVQNWNFLRFFPVVFYDFRNCDKVGYRLIILLHEVVELICAPKITIEQVSYLQNLIQEYLELRQDSFSHVPLRAKHHYMMHYPNLIIKFGPLIRLWTMRFESKHSYFKKCVHSCQNFINVTKTLSERHQLLQAYLGVGDLFNDIIFESAVPFCIFLYNKEIQDSVLLTLRENHIKAYVSDRITFRGIMYKKGLHVAVSRKEKYLYFGEILFILNLESKVFLVMNVFHSSYCNKTNLYIKEHELFFKCLEITELLDYYPLTAYKHGMEYLIVLKHSIIDNFQ